MYKDVIKNFLDSPSQVILATAPVEHVDDAMGSDIGDRLLPSRTERKVSRNIRLQLKPRQNFRYAGG